MMRLMTSLSVIMLKKLGLGDYFFKNFLVPMSSAVWSTPMNKMRDFPAKSLVRFFNNHGFVGVNTQLQWKTVNGGSREYRDRIMKSFKDKVHVNSGVKKIQQKDNEVIIQTSIGEQSFDKVIVATHADEALLLLGNPSLSKLTFLINFPIKKTRRSCT